MVEAIEAQQSPVAISNESSGDMVADGSSADSNSDSLTQGSKLTGEMEKRVSYDYAVTRLRGLLGDRINTSSGSPSREDDIRRVAAAVLDGLPGEAEMASMKDINELQHRLRTIVMNVTADVETVMGHKALSDLAVSQLTGASYLGGGTSPPVKELLAKLYARDSVFDQAPMLGAYEKAAESHARAVHAEAMR